MKKFLIFAACIAGGFFALLFFLSCRICYWREVHWNSDSSMDEALDELHGYEKHQAFCKKYPDECIDDIEVWFATFGYNQAWHYTVPPFSVTVGADFWSNEIDKKIIVNSLVIESSLGKKHEVDESQFPAVVETTKSSIYDEEHDEYKIFGRFHTPNIYDFNFRRKEVLIMEASVTVECDGKSKTKTIRDVLKPRVEWGLIEPRRF